MAAQRPDEQGGRHVADRNGDDVRLRGRRRRPRGECRAGPARRRPVSLVRFSGDVDFDATAYLVIAYFVATLATGIYGSLVAMREGRFAPTRGYGGIPVEIRSSEVPIRPPNPERDRAAAERGGGRLVRLHRSRRRHRLVAVEEALGPGHLVAT